MDLILSSGYLAFARHLGVIEAIEARCVTIDALVGTSSGALVGALWIAGMRPHRIAELLCSRVPMAWLGLSRTPWRGVFSTPGVERVLASQLPRTFEELPKPFAVGVSDREQKHRLISDGPLLPAVLASFAIPRLFCPQALAEGEYWDGGVVDRLGVDAWRAWRPGRSAILHRVQRSRGRDPSVEPQGLTLVDTPRAQATLVNLQDFYAQRERARTIAMAKLRQLGSR
jgi:predicted acylesterase/phospholipase RssA